MEDPDEPDELGQNSNSTGFDEDGIVNFLEEAIGSEVGTDILREFSHSDAFAELMEVVLSSSLIPSTSNVSSGRQLNQEADEKSDSPLDTNSDAKFESRLSEPSTSGTSRHKARTKVHQSIKTNARTKRSKKATVRQKDNEDSDSDTEKSRTRNQISDRLKIRLVPSLVKEKKSQKKSSPVKKNNVVLNNAESPSKGRKKRNKAGNTFDTEVDKVYNPPSETGEEDIPNDAKVELLKKKFKLKPFSVVLFDVKSLGVLLNDTTSQFPNVTVTLCDEKTNDLELLEELARRKFLKNSHQLFDIGHQSENSSSPLSLLLNDSVEEIESQKSLDLERTGITISTNIFEEPNLRSPENVEISETHQIESEISMVDSRVPENVEISETHQIESEISMVDSRTPENVEISETHQIESEISMVDSRTPENVEISETHQIESEIEISMTDTRTQKITEDICVDPTISTDLSSPLEVEATSVADSDTCRKTDCPDPGPEVETDTGMQACKVSELTFKTTLEPTNESITMEDPLIVQANVENTSIGAATDKEQVVLSSGENLENCEVIKVQPSEEEMRVPAKDLEDSGDTVDVVDIEVAATMELILQQILDSEAVGVSAQLDSLTESNNTTESDCKLQALKESPLLLDVNILNQAEGDRVSTNLDLAAVSHDHERSESIQTLDAPTVNKQVVDGSNIQSTIEDFHLVSTEPEPTDGYEDLDTHDDCHVSEKECDNDSDEVAKNLPSTKSKKSRPTAFALIDSDSESDSDEEIKLRQSSSSRSRVNDENLSGDSEDAKGQQFGRKRDKDDIRAKKFGKLESERRRKFSDKKKSPRAGFNAEDPLGQGKGLASSFKIPKRQSHKMLREGDDQSKITTPLAKQELPEVNLKFERCKKGKEGEKDFQKEKTGKYSRKDSERLPAKVESQTDDRLMTYAKYKKNKGGTDSKLMEKSQDKKPKKIDEKVEINEKNKSHRDKCKRKRYAIMSEDSDRLPPPPPSPPFLSKIESESPTHDSPVVFDEPDDRECDDDAEESLFGDCVNDSTAGPISDLQPGPLALQVAGLIRKGITDLPGLKHNDCPTEGTAQKCAWWFAKGIVESKEKADSQKIDFKASPIVFQSEPGSGSSFLGNISNSNFGAEKCQVNEISSTSRSETYVAPGGDLDQEECCGRSLLTAKIRDGTSDNFKNIFDLRPGTTYEKENFQAKCNLCNLLIIGRTDLAYHIRGISHSQKLKDLCEPIMGSPDEEIDSEIKSSKPSESKKPEGEEDQSKEKDSKDTKDSKDKEGKKDKKMEVENVKTDKRSKKECDMEVGRTSTGLKVKVPITGSSRKRSRSPVARRRTRSRSKSPVLRRRTRSRSKDRSRQRSRSRSGERRRRKSRSPIRRIPRSPTDKTKHASRRSRSPVRRDRNPRSRVVTSEERVKEFLARTRKSKSPNNGYSKRSRRSKSRSKSPKIVMKTGNREFHEKLALTAEGKWTPELEQSWKLMEAEEAIFKEQFYDLRKTYVTTPEDHPLYAEEWTKFWEKRYQEVEATGKDPDVHDYVSEWKEFWTRRLNLLLQDEADMRIKDIRLKYGMDFETLSKLRKPEIIKPEPKEIKSPNPANPLFILKPDPIMAAPASVLSNHSGRASISDNFSTKSMSISDGEIELSKIPASAPVTIEDFKSNWEAITRAKSNEPGINDSRGISGNRSDITSSSISSNDFGGFDLVQVLRLLSQCEDQLSFLAPKVFEYFKIAEEKELAKRRGSYELLENLELVPLLFQCKDRLITLIRSNVLSNESLKSINMTVYALDNILSDPRCKRTQAVVSQATVANTRRLDEPVEVNQGASFSQNTADRGTDSEWKDPRMDQKSRLKQKTEPRLLNQIQTVAEISKLMSKFSKEQKITIAGELANYLIANGRQGMSTSDLVDFVGTLLLPPLKNILKEKERKEQIQKERLVLVDPFKTDVSPEDDKSKATKVYGVTSQRVVGSALPVLPAQAYTLPKSAGVPKLPPGYIANHSNVPPPRLSGKSGPNRSGDEPEGRTSPFSCRDYSGNPLAEGRL